MEMAEATREMELAATICLHLGVSVLLWYDLF
jgi:hypothetical protein